MRWKGVPIILTTNVLPSIMREPKRRANEEDYEYQDRCNNFKAFQARCRQTRVERSHQNSDQFPYTIEQLALYMQHLCDVLEPKHEEDPVEEAVEEQINQPSSLVNEEEDKKNQEEITQILERNAAIAKSAFQHIPKRQKVAEEEEIDLQGIPDAILDDDKENVEPNAEAKPEEDAKKDADPKDDDSEDEQGIAQMTYCTHVQN